MRLTLATVAILATTSAAFADSHLSIGRSVYERACASCHGANLEGQPDWMRRKPDGKLPAPPHDVTGHSWHHSDGELFRIVKEGPGAILQGYKSDMPGFAATLTEDEIRAVIDYIKSTWPQRQQGIQSAITKRRD